MGDVEDEDDAIHCWNRSDVTDDVLFGLVSWLLDRRTSSVTRCTRRRMSGGAFSRNHCSMASPCVSNMWLIGSVDDSPSSVDPSELLHGEMGTGDKWRTIVEQNEGFADSLLESVAALYKLVHSSPLSGLHMVVIDGGCGVAIDDTTNFQTDFT